MNRREQGDSNGRTIVKVWLETHFSHSKESCFIQIGVAARRVQRGAQHRTCQVYVRSDYSWAGDLALGHHAVHLEVVARERFKLFQRDHFHRP